MTPRDNLSMDCSAARELLSARHDGDDLDPIASGRLDAHLDGCGACREHAAGMRALRPRTLRPAEASDSVVGRVLAALEPDRSTAPETKLVRIALFVVAVAQAAVAVPQLLHGGSGLAAHQARHVGVFSLALAVGFAYTALRPRRVGALLPFAGALAVGLILTGVIDAVAGRTPIAGESAHLLDVVGLTLMWVLIRLERPRPRRGRAEPLHSVGPRRDG